MTNFADVTATGLRSIRKAEQRHRVPQLVTELGIFMVTSDRDPSRVYQVTVPAGQVTTSPIALRCTCPSGEARPDFPVPCWHAATVGLDLVARGIARTATGMFYAVPTLAASS